jgi:hypothetical protein
MLFKVFKTFTSTPTCSLLLKSQNFSKYALLRQQQQQQQPEQIKVTSAAEPINEIIELSSIEKKQAQIKADELAIKLKREEMLQQIKAQSSVISKFNINNFTPQLLQPYINLMRLDKPAPIGLLYWPGAWAILGAASFQYQTLPDFSMLALFGVGALSMRSAGCIINDLWDRDLDKKVERTKNRPLASGQLGVNFNFKFIEIRQHLI